MGEHRSAGNAVQELHISFCDVYEAPDGKPTDILWDKAECEWHVEKL